MQEIQFSISLALIVESVEQLPTSHKIIHKASIPLNLSFLFSQQIPPQKQQIVLGERKIN